MHLIIRTFLLLILAAPAFAGMSDTAFIQEHPKHHRLGEGFDSESEKGKRVAQAVKDLFEGERDLLVSSRRVITKSAPTKPLYEAEGGILSAAVGSAGAVAVGTETGLLIRSGEGQEFEEIYPADEKYSWAPRNVSVVHYDSEGNLWFGSDQGAGVFDGERWRLFTGQEGLPTNQFTCAASGPGEVWFGTKRGALRWNGEEWDYRARDRWALADEIRAIAVDENGTAWIRTDPGVTEIRKIEMTLEQKAEHFIEQIEKYNTRDGYVTDWVLKEQGVIESATAKITDNDGTYTGWFGAAMCFRYAVTGDPEAKRLAKRSFEACKRLVDIVPESMKGFPARVIIPVDWHEPVNEQYGPEYNAAKRKGDPFWKLITPRFPLSEDGKYRWKCDTSSDEISGHFILYDAYYDLVAETEEEKAPVREVVRDIMDHLIRNDYNLIDHDGTPTRWGRFGPDFIYSPLGWEQRGLNSLMVLSFLHTAHKITGDSKYLEAADELREKWLFQTNVLEPRPFFPPENIVPWDNGFVFTSGHMLMKNDPNPENRLLLRIGVENAWQFISKQKNPYWNFYYGAMCRVFSDLARNGHFEGCFPEAGPWAERWVNQLTEFEPDVEGNLESLKKMPLELIAWDMFNSHRLDFEQDPMPLRDSQYGWSKVDRKAFPYDERCHVRLDRDCFDVDLTEGGEGNGYSLHEGTMFLLPYYLGRYSGFID